MINKTLNDETQIKILPILKETENLFLTAIEKESGSSGMVSITAMPDLGLANNAMRMAGGFFTGMFLEWESKSPIVPIDTTINSCGVAIYLLKKQMSIEGFEDCFNKAIDKRIKRELGYNWNFERGNHFITLGQLEDGCNCIVMHASADEYKQEIKGKALYPEPDVWFYDKIKTIRGVTNENRYLRYLYGTDAEKFISIAVGLEEINHKRMFDIATLLFGDYIDKEIVFVPHYGMPTKNSIAIGCSWSKSVSILLTVPGKDVYIVKPTDCINADKWLTPHGLGVSASIDEIKYESGLYINAIKINDTKDIMEIKNRSIRCKNSDVDSFRKHRNEALEKCNAMIDTVIHPIATLSADGFDTYIN